MNRKYIAVLVIISLLSLNTLTPAQAFWPFSEPEPGNKDLRFETVYPVSFWDSTTGTVLKYTGVGVVTFAVTWFGGPAVTIASAKIMSSFLWGPVLSVAGVSLATAGTSLFLADIMAGGLGILGITSVLSAVSSVALTAAVNSQIPSGVHVKAITLIKTPSILG